MERKDLPVEVNAVDTRLDGVVGDELGVGLAVLGRGEVGAQLALARRPEIGDGRVDLDARCLEGLALPVELRRGPRSGPAGVKAVPPVALLVVVAVVVEAEGVLLALEGPPEHRDLSDDSIGRRCHLGDGGVGSPPAEPARDDRPRSLGRDGRRGSHERGGRDRSRGDECGDPAQAHGAPFDSLQATSGVAPSGSTERSAMGIPRAICITSGATVSRGRGRSPEPLARHAARPRREGQPGPPPQLPPRRGCRGRGLRCRCCPGTPRW